jgi:hypothetical protein
MGKLFGKHKTSKKPAMVRVDDGVITILVRKKLVDEFMNSKCGCDLGLPKEAVVAIMAAQLAGYPQKKAALFGQRYSEGKVMVKYLRSGCKLVKDPSFDEPCYVVMSNV